MFNVILKYKLLSLQFIIIFIFSNVSYLNVGERRVEGELKLFGIATDSISVYGILVFLIVVILLSQKVPYPNLSVGLFILACVLLLYFITTVLNFQGSQDANAIIGLILKVGYVHLMISKIPFSLKTEYVSQLLVFISFFSAVLGLILFFGVDFLGFSQIGYVRAISIYGNPNVFATILGIGLVLLLVKMMKNKLTHYEFVTIFILFLSLILTASITLIVLISVIISYRILYYVISFIKYGKISSAHFIVFFTLFIVFFIVNFLINKGVDITLLKRLSDVDQVSSASGRTDIWEFYLKGFMDSSLVDQLFGKGRLYLTERSGYDRSAHSFYLRYIIEHGVLFLMTYMVLCIYLIKSLLKMYYRNDDIWSLALAVSLFVILVRNFSTPELMSNRLADWMFWFITIIVLFYRNKQPAIN